MVEPKKRKIRETDWKKLETYINGEVDARKKSQFRKDHEQRWKEVDRQLKMKEMQRFSASGQPIPNTWHNVFELGELSKASEIICDDVMRIIFPDDRRWFEAHVELNRELDAQTGRPVPVDDKKQSIADGLLRNLMLQQHKDFGFKDRFRLSVKEALHHGSYVAKVDFAKEMMVIDGTKVKLVGAPVWTPISMWNAYPDPSPSVIGTNLFYTGSMIVEEFMPKWKLKRIAKGDGWMPARLEKIPTERHTNGDVDTEDIRLTYWFGDLNIERSDGDMFYPNHKAILANGVIVYMAPNDLPHSPIIFNGYERQDVRDPYYTSPLIKQSPMQKITTVLANKYLDAISLKVEPPIEYDANDPDYVANDGPTIEPGARTGTRSMGNGFKALDIGDPRWALEGLQLGLRQMQEGTGVSALRAGMTNSDRQTATEINKVVQGGEVRTVAFVAVLEQGGLTPFLYMQHELNRKYMDEYAFYNDEMHTPDFVRASKENIQKNVHFEVVGSKGLLGEEQRTQRVGAATAFFSSNPLFAPKLKVTDIMLQTYRDAGLKNPEDYVQTDENPQIPPQLQAQIQQMQQGFEQAKGVIAQLQQENQQLKQGAQIKMAEIQSKEKIAQAELAADMQKHRSQMAFQTDKEKAGMIKDASDKRSEQASEAREEALEVARTAAEVDLLQAQVLKTLAEANAVPSQELRESGESKE